MTAGPSAWFDVEDLLHHFRGGHSHLSGIQRLTLEVYRAAQNAHSADGRVRFVRHGQCGEPPLVPITWAQLDAAYRRAQERTEPTPKAVPKAADGSRPPAWTRMQGAAARLGSRPRGNLRSAAIAQAQAIVSLGRFGLAMMTYPARNLGAVAEHSVRKFMMRAPTRTQDPAEAIAAYEEHSNPLSFEEEAQPGDILIALGSPWFIDNYSHIVRWARDTRRLRFGALIHDMVPMNHPEWCDAGVIRTFRSWHETVLPLCDIVLTNSRHTAKEVERWASRAGIRLSVPARPVPIGTGFGIKINPACPRTPKLPRAGTYVLYVSTLEARKNHMLLARVWRKLLEEENLGLRQRGSVPKLVFAGRVGWLVSDLLQQLENASWFNGRVMLIRDCSDVELRALYEGSIFNIFPSWHEGWGLPVTEALGLGVPVLCSSAGALPEAGGSLARYFDPGDTEDCRRAVATLLDNPEELDAWRAEIRTRFRPVPWSATAHAVLEAAWSLG